MWEQRIAVQIFAEGKCLKHQALATHSPEPPTSPGISRPFFMYLAPAELHQSHRP